MKRIAYRGLGIADSKLRANRNRARRRKAAPSANIILIGMPGAGKSTVGVLLAKALSRDFLDTDVYIQAKQARTLQEIIDQDGLPAFCRIEERHVLSLRCRSSVIATGGSVVYSPAAMARLQASGIIIHMDLDLNALGKRLTDLSSRGVVMGPGQTLPQLFAEREPLYRKYADLTIDCAGCTHEEIVAMMVRRLSRLDSPPARRQTRTGVATGKERKRTP
jgi:shikimate kinase